MKTLVRYFLLLGAMLGLLWQGMAFASPPCAEMQQEPAVAMAGMADCMDTEKQTSKDTGKDSGPCDDMKAGCMAMVGCASLIALDVQPVIAVAAIDTAITALWPAAHILLGRNDAPDPEPPSILG